MRLVFDIEADGLYQKATKIWCVCAEDIDTGEKYEWHWTKENPDPTLWVFNVLEKADELIGHNIINYDIPLLKKLIDSRFEENVKITDTLVMSRLLNPDRGKPTGYAGKGGPNSLEAWGYRVGKGKPYHEDWSVFSSDMLRRCREDVGINVLTYHTLSGEIGEHPWEESIRIEHDIARIITEQEHHGILFDREGAIELCRELEDKIAEIDDELLPNLPHAVKQIGSVPVNRPFLKTGGYTQATRKYLEDAYPTYEDNLIGGPFTRIKFIPFDLGSVQQVKQFLLENGWEPDNYNYSKASGERTSPKLDGDFSGVDGYLPKRVRERITWRHRKSQIEGWLGNLREDGRLSAGANTCGTNTGRMRHQTVVNVPKANKDKKTGELIWDTSLQSDIFGTQMRSLFIAPEGYKIVGHDASGLELRMLAHYMGDEEYIDQILTGDIHEFNRNAAGLPNRDAAKTFI